MGLIEAIDAVLPQTQCRECGYPGCKPYATAIAENKVSIDKCAPGGLETLQALGSLLQIEVKPYIQAVQANTRQPSVANIQESECIGCTKCIQACPVDAIVGAAQKMHAVIAEACTGCGLCVEPCPVDCIDMLPMKSPRYDPTLARKRFEAREKRMQEKKAPMKTDQKAFLQAALARFEAKHE
jgi:Na+-translocating ferredoxin:NAD+ oxidoreductase subunit B